MPSTAALRANDRLRTLRRDHKRDTLAERLAEHGNIKRAADETGVSHSYGRLLFAEIKRGLGWQAK